MKKYFPFVGALVGGIVSGVIVWKAAQLINYAFIIVSIVSLYLVCNKNNPFK